MGDSLAKCIKEERGKTEKGLFFYDNRADPDIVSYNEVTMKTEPFGYNLGLSE